MVRRLYHITHGQKGKRGKGAGKGKRTIYNALFPHGPWSPHAGLLKSPNRPLGKSSHDAAAFNSPLPASWDEALGKEVSPAEAALTASRAGRMRESDSVVVWVSSGGEGVIEPFRRGEGLVTPFVRGGGGGGAELDACTLARSALS